MHKPLASSSSSSQAPTGSSSCPLGSQEPRLECKGKKKSLCTQAMSSSKLHKAGTGREDVIPLLAGHWWWEQEQGSCSPGTPSPGHGWDREMDKFPHKDLAHRQNNLFPHKFRCFCWLKAGLHCYFNIVICIFNAMWGFFPKMLVNTQMHKPFFFFGFLRLLIFS